MSVESRSPIDPLLCCPVCQLSLLIEKDRLVCNSGHSYDLSSKGHAHLIPGTAQGVSGDSAEMVRARRRFLKSGYYAALQQKLAMLVIEALSQVTDQKQLLVLDAGCGEGYYTGAIAESLSAHFPHAHCYGTDISKDAVRLSAGSCKRAFFFVSSVFSMPIPSNTLNLITCVFAPDAHVEFERVLKTGGTLITVTPGVKHLGELKQVLYEQVIDNPPVGPSPLGFTAVRHEQLDLQATIEGIDRDTGIPHLHDLLAMTPYYWKTPAAGVQRLKALNQLQITLSFCLDIYRKS